MTELLITVMLVAGFLALVVTALLRTLPSRYVANNLGQSLRKSAGIYPDVNRSYLSRLGVFLYLVRWICFAIFLLCLIVGIWFEQV